MTSGSRTKLRMAKAEQARKTRRTVVEAATRLFVRDGFVTTTMAAIAAEAGVAVQTLYLSFRSKTAILGAAFDQALAGDDEPIPLLDRDWMRAILADPDGPAALAGFVEHSTPVIERAASLYVVLRSAAADPEVAEVLSKNKRERRRHFGVLVDSLAEKTGFTSAISPKEGADILYAVLSEDSFALLVHEQAWTPDQWRRWTLRTLMPQLFPGASG